MGSATAQNPAASVATEPVVAQPGSIVTAHDSATAKARGPRRRFRCPDAAGKFSHRLGPSGIEKPSFGESPQQRRDEVADKSQKRESMAHQPSFLLAMTRNIVEATKDSPVTIWRTASAS